LLLLLAETACGPSLANTFKTISYVSAVANTGRKMRGYAVFSRRKTLLNVRETI